MRARKKRDQDEQGSAEHVDAATADPAVRPRARWWRRPRNAAVVLAATAVTLVVTFTAVSSSDTEHGAAPATTVATNSGTPTTTATSTAPAPSGGGASQTVAPSFPTTSMPGQGVFNGVACQSTVACLAVGEKQNGTGVISQSSDGGSSWANRPLARVGGALEAVDCGTKAVCVAVGQGTALSSTDGGGSWTSHGLPTPNTTLLGVACTSAARCVADGIMAQTTSAYAGQIVYSTDGGANWVKASFPSWTPGLGSVACPTATRCIAVGAAILTSDDAGKTWQVRTVPGGVPGGALRTVSCSSAVRCIAIGPSPDVINDPTASGVAVVTTDGGTTWQQLPLPASSGASQYITCSGTSCLIGGPGATPTAAATYEVSSDGGSTWSAAPPPPRLGTITGLSCPSAAHCVVVGTNQAPQPVGSTPTLPSTAVGLTGVTNDRTTWAVTQTAAS